MGEKKTGKKGFILPIFLTKTSEEIQNAVRSTIFSSSEKRSLNLEVSTISDYAIALQNELMKEYPSTE